MRDLKITPRLITRRDKKVWHLDALIPKDLRHHNGNRDKLRRSCGTANTFPYVHDLTADLEKKFLFIPLKNL